MEQICTELDKVGAGAAAGSHVALTEARNALKEAAKNLLTVRADLQRGDAELCVHRDRGATRLG